MKMATPLSDLGMATRATGSTPACIVAQAAVLVCAMSGPPVGFSEREPWFSILRHLL